MTTLWKYVVKNQKNVVIIGDSMLNNMDGTGVSKSKKPMF